MKPKLTLALVALITGTAFGSMPAVLPEFKDAKQLAAWRAEMAVNSTPQTTATDDHTFYTGKPYVESSGGYAFKYRNYNPVLARWTSEDPSGFPDGANSVLYTRTPTSMIDRQGLFIMPITGQDLGSLGEFTQEAIEAVTGGIDRTTTIPGSTWMNPSNAPGNATITYSLTGDFKVNATILGTGVEGTATGGTAGQFEVKPGWSIRLDVVWNISLSTDLAGMISHKAWKPVYFE